MPVVSLTRNQGDLRKSLSKYCFHLGHWMLFLICTGQRSWSRQAETQPCCPGSRVSHLMPFSEPWDIPMSWIQDVLGRGKDNGMKRKAYTGKGYYRLRGTFRNTGDLISVYTTVNEPCTALVSKNFSLAHSFFADVQTAGQKLFCEIGVFLMKKITPHHQHMPPPAPFRFRRRAAWSPRTSDWTLTSLQDTPCFAFSFVSKRYEKT